MIEIGHIDLNVVEHCNFSCCACSHASPLHKPWSMPLEMIERDLTALKPILKCHSVQVLGGEPLLHPQIVEVLRLVKRVGLGRQMTVITNGALLPKMSDEFWRELDYLQISVYPKLSKEIVPFVHERKKQLGLKFGIGVTEFEVFYRQLKSEPDDGRESFKDCHWKRECLTVHRGHFHLCAQSTFFPKALMNLPAHTDGLPLEGITEEKLRAFMDRTEPFAACRICRANTMLSDPWREVKRSEWIKESTV